MVSCCKGGRLSPEKSGLGREGVGSELMGMLGRSGAAEEGEYEGGASARSNISSLPFPPGSVEEPGEQTYISGGSLMLVKLSSLS